SLNVPAVDLLDRVGPARFAARLDNAGISLKFPRGATPNLTLILGGTGARLEDLVGAHAALHRDGTAGRVRYTPDDPVIDRRLLSPGAAWIVREILESNPRPGEREGMFDDGRRPRVSWKTGTSYGFRDAWAIGGTKRHTAGVWVGRPDGTPLPGQYGAITALPLLFEVIDSLPRARGDGARTPPPVNVAEHAICWPLGTAAEAQPAPLCQRRFDAWVLDGVIPPTFPERDARLWSAGLECFDVDASSGLRLSADCRQLHVRETMAVARWPALASPWLSSSTRRASRPPPLSPDCIDDGRDAVGELRIEGLNDGASLARPPGSARGIRLSLRAIGSDAPVQWLLDGRWIAQTRGANAFQHSFETTGTHRLTALADSGAWASVEFRILPD
ncbi:MAG TPA: penicillin-binding protein 1C, partial [Luteimonas sp.]|nr:penicillin-binding protein 1C [Luteimonas sp.]